LSLERVDHAASRRDEIRKRTAPKMLKMKTHKGMKKRFKISANGKVRHKRCGSSHLMSHKSGKQVRRLRKKSTLTVAAEAKRIRHALLEKQGVNADQVHAEKLAAVAQAAATGQGGPTEGAGSS
jgi:large subunit ribosomal protein L35